MDSQNEKLVFGFDVGLGSLGVAVRRGDEIIDAHSYLIDSDVGSLKEERERRRAYRTRQAHKAREQWLERAWKEIGKEPLHGIRNKKENGKWTAYKGDERLEREFPKKGDDTVYNSALLRIMLIEGEKLEDWQTYKALRSAIQRRGYDDNVPWKRKVVNEDKNNEPDKESQKILDEQRNGENSGKDPRNKIDSKYRLPCYYDALMMGLWNPDHGIVNIRQQASPQEARGFLMTREEVRTELDKLIDQASKQMPGLRNKKNYILYGGDFDTKEYHSYKKWEGVLSQKAPRFDNRVVNKCVLMPRFHICSTSDPLYIRVSFLLQLKNVRYSFHGDKNTYYLSPEQIRELYKICHDKWLKRVNGGKLNSDRKADNYATDFKFTANNLKKELEKIIGQEIVVGGKVETDKAKITGRGRYSRPALKVLEEVLISDLSPKDFYKELVYTIDDGYIVYDSFMKYKLQKNDIDFLLKCGEQEGFFIPQLSFMEKYGTDSKSAIKNLIGDCHDPVIRHRLVFLNRILDSLVESHGKPDYVVFEFVREDFVGAKKKREYQHRSKEGQKDREQTRQSLKDRNFTTTETNIRKMRLLKEQDYKCIYTGDALSVANIENYEIEHIIPRGGGYNGPDSFWNVVLTSHDVNQEKKERLPLDFIASSEVDSFKERVKNSKLIAIKKKVLLCPTKEEADLLLDRYRGLAITSWNARLSRDLVCLKFDWQIGEKGEARRVEVVSGGVVAKTRKGNNLDFILYDAKNADEEKDKKVIIKKNRDDKRHHALDAMVICYLSEWARNPNNPIYKNTKDGFFRFPGLVGKNPHQYFANKLKALAVMPDLRYSLPPGLNENPYGLREKDGKKIVVIKKRLLDIISNGDEGEKRRYKGSGKNKIFDDRIREAVSEYIYKEKLVNKSGVALEDSVQGMKKYIAEKLKLNNTPNKILIRESLTIGLYKDLKKDNGIVLGEQLFTNEQSSSSGTMRKGFLIIKDDKGRYDLRAVNAFDSVVEVKNLLKKEGYEIVFEKELNKSKKKYKVLSKGIFFHTDRGLLRLVKTGGGNSLRLLSYDNKVINSKGDLVDSSDKNKNILCSVKFFMSLNPRIEI